MVAIHMPQVMRSFNVVYSPAGERLRRSVRSCGQLKWKRLNYLVNFLLKIFLFFRRPSASTLAILCLICSRVNCICDVASIIAIIILSPLSGWSRVYYLIISSDSFSSKGHFSSSCKYIKIFYFI
jgi:hypothetical protein